MLASFWGALGFIFKQLRRPFRSSRALRQTIENTLRNHWSKGLVLAWPAFGGRKRNHDEGFTFFSGQERLLCLRIQLASQTCFLIRRNSKTHGFYVVPCFPSLSSPTRGSPRLEITRKCSSKSLVKRSFETAAGQKRIRTMARWPGFGGACPTGDPATEPRRGRAWPSRSVLVNVWTLKKCPKRTQRLYRRYRTPQNPLPLGPPTYRGPLLLGPKIPRH